MITKQLRTIFWIALAATTISTGARAVAFQPLSVNDPRPLAQLVSQLQEAYGFVVTYEDPPFASESDVVPVKNSRASYRELIPRGGAFAPAFAAPPPGATLAENAAMVENIIGQYHATGYPGKFRVIVGKYALHVVPTAVTGRDGALTTMGSLLDTRVSIPAQEGRTLYDGLTAVFDAVGAATGQRISSATVPINLLKQSQMEAAFTRVPAREILEQAFHATGRQLSWRLLYSPGLQAYYFNSRIVNSEPAK
jgi:hypothetical protein